MECRNPEPETTHTGLVWTLDHLRVRATFRPHMVAQMPFLCSGETAHLLYSSSRVAKADGSELLRSPGLHIAPEGNFNP